MDINIYIKKIIINLFNDFCISIYLFILRYYYLYITFNYNEHHKSHQPEN